jgi:hypothetical protein
MAAKKAAYIRFTSLETHFHYFRPIFPTGLCGARSVVGSQRAAIHIVGANQFGVVESEI